MNLHSIKKNILVVDDDSLVHFISEKLAQSVHWINKIHCAFNGQEALSILDNYCNGLIALPHVILLDMHMPVMDGLQFLKAYREMECMKDEKVVIVMVSSCENPQEIAEAHSMGINYFFSKPISLAK